MRFITSIAAALVEAWGELRVSRLRVMLSLIGVAVAVAALTAVTALGAVAEQSQREQQERYQGRPALLTFMPSDSTGMKSPDPSLTTTAFQDAADRYGIDWTSRVLQDSGSVELPRGVTEMPIMAVDPDYGTMHRIAVREGRWFDADDADRFAPAVIVSTDLWKELGSPDLRTHPHFELSGTSPSTAVVIGVTGETCDGQCLSMTMLYDDFVKTGFTRIDDGPGAYIPQPSYEAWVPPSTAKKLMPRIASAMSLALGDGWQINPSRMDYAAQLGGYDPYLPLKLAVGGIAGLVLLLGALGLVNISLVTVRYRVREIGIRRSFGATAGRVFFGVMMESVVATVVAGLIGVAIAVAVLKNPTVIGFITSSVQDVPPFPISAALIGLGSSAAVGALAGLVPALVAVRVKPIDAIRL
ncbi:ABC transporter permease [Schumannella sp. 10F1B-5-1]|uniref:ABC transporter permease n=1 Tax=Schumannella sp. 10F1B-5-1 TaxID=2590780 RepID=UPI001131F1C1|nr:ABC transporter permease [Schumannella sp. 10F1B-5-1]TPW70255.1 FtsX-like permease family protein [Schumannella sp. 10F1B-5-1]